MGMLCDEIEAGDYGLDPGDQTHQCLMASDAYIYLASWLEQLDGIISTFALNETSAQVEKFTSQQSSIA